VIPPSILLIPNAYIVDSSGLLLIFYINCFLITIKNCKTKTTNKEVGIEE